MFFQVTPGKLLSWKKRRRIKPLIKSLSNPDMNIKTIAVQSLGEIGDQEALPAMVILLKDPDPDVRYIASEAIAPMANDSILADLIKGLYDDSWLVRFSILRALSKIGSVRAVNAIIGQLKNEHAPEQLQLILELLKGRVGVGHMHDLYHLLLDCRKEMAANPGYRELSERLKILITAVGGDGVAYLRKHLEQAGKEDRLLLIELIAGMGGRTAVQVLESLLRDPDPEVQLDALVCMSRLPTAKSSDGWLLVAVLSPARRFEDRRVILRNLLDRGAVSEKLIPWVKFWLDNDDAFDGAPAAQFRQQLVMASFHREPDIRLRALIGLRRLGDLATLAGLTERLLDSDPRIREIVNREAVPFVAGPDKEFLEIWSGVHFDPLVMRMKNSPVRKKMVRLLADPVPMIRARAAYLIGLGTDPDLLSPVKQLFNDPVRYVAICARDAVQRCEPGASDRPLLPADLRLNMFEPMVKDLG
ncbi:HEAT repeat domain-containing protein [bacterium]|nr:HEAT repeat domain-containing protein [candidate division CSSED10-310 bacterium]